MLSQQQQQKVLDELTPGQRLRVEVLLSVYADILKDFEVVEFALDRESATLGKILADAGIKSTETADFVAYWTRGATTKKTDHAKLIAQGVTKAQIEAATIEKPRKDSFTIRAKKRADVDPDE